MPKSGSLHHKPLALKIRKIQGNTAWFDTLPRLTLPGDDVAWAVPFQRLLPTHQQRSAQQAA